MDLLKQASDAVGDAANAVTGAAGDAADAVKGAVGLDTEYQEAAKVVEAEIEKQTGSKIEVEFKDIPSSWRSWVLKTGVNSLCNDSTWDFLEKNSWNQRKVDNWAKRGFKKIIVTVNEHPENDMDSWAVCDVKWKDGDTEFTVEFLPRAGNWSSDNSWNDSGYKRWWILRDEIVFGTQLYQLPGKCFYKSDWLDGVEDPDPDAMGPIPRSKKFKRWFQFRHWIIYWYENARWGWNYQYTTKPPPNPDGSIFDLDSVLSLPGMPDFSMPKLKLPSMPNLSLPDAPSLPDVSLPDAPSLPSLSAPSIPDFDPSAPSLPSLPEQPKRPSGYWDCHGYIELEGLKVKAKGKTIIFSDAKITHFWKAKNGGSGIDTETKEHSRMELECTDEEQAQSWEDSLVEAGCEVGDVGGCCTVA